LFECGEAVIKYSTKKGSNKPPVEDIVKEFGDVILRGMMFFQKLDPEDLYVGKIMEEHLKKKEEGIVKRFQTKPEAKDA